MEEEELRGEEEGKGGESKEKWCFCKFEKPNRVCRSLEFKGDNRLFSNLKTRYKYSLVRSDDKTFCGRGFGLCSE